MVAPALHDLGSENTGIPSPLVSSLADLLSIWQRWSYRDRLTRQIADARQARDTPRVATLTYRLHSAPPGVTALEALAANHHLATLLVEWQGHALRAARQAGASWQQIATATGTTAEQACAACLAHTEYVNLNTDVLPAADPPPDPPRTTPPDARSGLGPTPRQSSVPMTEDQPATAVGAGQRRAEAGGDYGKAKRAVQPSVR